MKNKLILFAALILFAVRPAFSEKADRDKPIQIDADRIEVDDAKKISTFEGNVVLTQGTMVIRADKIVVTEDKEGNRHAVATGRRVYFRQKREGYDEYIEGEGDRAEYDSKSDTVEFFGNAVVKRGQDVVRGNTISYNGSTEFFQSVGAGPKAPGGRVHAVITPKKKDEGKAPPATLEPATTIENPPQK